MAGETRKAGERLARRLARRSGISRRQAHRTIGAAPGTMEVSPDAQPTQLRAFAYGPDGLQEAEGDSLAILDGFEASPVLWLDVVGLGTVELLGEVAERFAIHPLAMEDVTHVHQLPKIEAYPESLFVSIRRLYHDAEQSLMTEQISLVLTEGAVITFQEFAEDCFSPVRERLRKGRGRLRRFGPDYLTYALLDAAVDHIFPALDAIQDQLERIELEILDNANRSSSSQPVVALTHLKKELLRVHQCSRPLKEALVLILREEEEEEDEEENFFSEETRPYLRDCVDHLGQVQNVIEFCREQNTNLINLHLALAGQQLNEVMRLLTVISTVFIPLSFIVGLYGMNFDPSSPYNMPELRSPYGYPMVLGLMALVTSGLLGFFWRRGWLSR